MELYRLLKDADYDGALALCTATRLENLLKTGTQLERLRTACMIADVFDYAGRYEEARGVIENAGRDAEERLTSVESIVDIGEPQYTKQECWALLMWGMSFYRTGGGGFVEAMKRFETARKVLQMLLENGTSCIGTLSRAWYCIGLVHRQRKEYTTAKAAFVQSLEFGGLGVKTRKEAHLSTASYDFNMARCLGLGLGWIAYDESQLDDAKGHLILARRALLGNRVRFIRAYVEVVHACILMSAHTNEIERITDAINMLKAANEVLVFGAIAKHEPYACRTAVELALAYLRRARLLKTVEKDQDLSTAEDILRELAASPSLANDRRTQCAALIAQSRIHRERGQKIDALDKATKAARLSHGMRFSHIDALICLGEAYYEQAEYRKAADNFDAALDLGRNSRKIAAVCHVHLARVWIKSQQPGIAIEHFAEWKALEPSLQNSFIKSFAAQVFDEQIGPSLAFHIPDDVIDLDAKKHVARLHRWLVLKALSRTKDNFERAAGLVDATVPTMKTWLKEGAEAERSGKAVGA